MPPLVNGNYFRPWQNVISNAGFSCSFSLWSAVIRRKTKQAAKTDIVNLGTRFISKKKRRKLHSLHHIEQAKNGSATEALLIP